MGTEMTGADIVVQALTDLGVEVVFGYPGGAVLPIYDALFKQNRIRHILVRHEQAAVHAAEGYARSSGKVGVVLVTLGLLLRSRFRRQPNHCASGSGCGCPGTQAGSATRPVPGLVVSGRRGEIPHLRIR